MGKHNFIAGPALYMAPVTLQVSQSRVESRPVMSNPVRRKTYLKMSILICEKWE